uniref:Cilia- and flagella-associated protein 99 n=1 Tax=Pyxicephalus adspersus TaxID=30357 RepID=A0AAV3APG8_PYXAD|nr:TPA: hypothetical protein GDO54_009604 [Pyxicephalus adspersus]DBA29375.1 TPA: hypothetical protein GDO54_009604 [Pyxicephalus adspersus]
MTNYGRCINLIAHLLNKYNPENQSLEHFLEDSAEDLQKLNIIEDQFVLEVLSGCVQYRDVLDIVVDAFYARDGRNSLKSEHCLYLVICYITTFRLEEFGFQLFSRVIRSQDVTKMSKFLRFFLDHLNLNTWIKDEWSQIYDSNYVKENWIFPLLNTYKTPKEQEILQEKKQKNRQKAEGLLVEANMAQFKCANAEKSEKTKRVLAEIMKEEDNKIAFNKTKAQQVSIKKVDNVPVKLNATAILREGALYQRQVEKELQRIEKLVDGARDPSEFLEWQRQMREKDLERQLAEIECRRLEGKLSREEAVLARQNLIRENKKKAEMKKEEAQKLMRQYAEKRLQEEREMRDLVEQVSEGRKNTKQARLKLQKYKQRIVQEVTEESRELLRQALEEAEEELKRKFELIREIRAMESVPIIRHKFVDSTETAGHGLNCEMSIAELHERLSLLKEAQKKAEEEKRDQILEEKQTKQQLLLDTLEQISLHRTALGKASLLKSEEKKAKSQFGKAAVAKDDRVTELQKKLEEKITERKRQAEALKLNPQRNIAKSSKNSFEEKHWKELEESRERQAQLFKHGTVSQETANRLAAYQAARRGDSTICLL